MLSSVVLCISSISRHTSWALVMTWSWRQQKRSLETTRHSQRQGVFFQSFFVQWRFFLLIISMSAIDFNWFHAFIKWLANHVGQSRAWLTLPKPISEAGFKKVLVKEVGSDRVKVPIYADLRYVSESPAAFQAHLNFFWFFLGNTLAFEG